LLKKILLSLVLLLLLAVLPPVAAVANGIVTIENATMPVMVSVIPRPAIAPGGGNGGSGETVYTPESPDGKVEITVPGDTVIRNSAGGVIPGYRVRVDDYPNPPAPPVDSHIIGLAYDFQPAGATFSPPVTLTFTLPEGIDISGLVLAFYDTATGEWVLLESTIDTEMGTITASMSHFTVFAVLAIPPAVEPTPVEPVVVVVEPSSPGPVTPAPPVEPPPTTPAPEPELVVPEPVPAPEPAPVEPVAPIDTGVSGWGPFGWALIGFGALLLIGLGIQWVIRRRHLSG